MPRTLNPQLTRAYLRRMPPPISGAFAAWLDDQRDPEANFGRGVRLYANLAWFVGVVCVAEWVAARGWQKFVGVARENRAIREWLDGKTLYNMAQAIRWAARDGGRQNVVLNGSGLGSLPEFAEFFGKEPMVDDIRGARNFVAHRLRLDGRDLQAREERLAQQLTTILEALEPFAQLRWGVLRAAAGQAGRDFEFLPWTTGAAPGRALQLQAQNHVKLAGEEAIVVIGPNGGVLGVEPFVRRSQAGWEVVAEARDPSLPAGWSYESASSFHSQSATPASVDRPLGRPFGVERAFATTVVEAITGDIATWAAWLHRYVPTGRTVAGGSADVTIAHDELLDRLVAIKRLRHTEADDHRIRREARALARLRHPGVVTVYDVGRDQDGNPVLVLEHADGVPLADVAHGNPQAADAIAWMFEQLCDAVAAMHNQNVLHRDLSPHNILVDSASRRVRIVDFGLAKVLPAGDMTQQGHTVAQYALGTAGFCAPEVRAKGLGAATPQSDIYALGQLLVLVATGEDPNEPAALRKFDADWPQLRGLHDRATAPQATARFASVAELWSGLRGALETAAKARSRRALKDATAPGSPLHKWVAEAVARERPSNSEGAETPSAPPSTASAATAVPKQSKQSSASTTWTQGKVIDLPAAPGLVTAVQFDALLVTLPTAGNEWRTQVLHWPLLGRAQDGSRSTKLVANTSPGLAWNSTTRRGIVLLYQRQRSETVVRVLTDADDRPATNPWPFEASLPAITPSGQVIACHVRYDHSSHVHIYHMGADGGLTAPVELSAPGLGDVCALAFADDNSLLAHTARGQVYRCDGQRDWYAVGPWRELDVLADLACNKTWLSRSGRHVAALATDTNGEQRIVVRSTSAGASPTYRIGLGSNVPPMAVDLALTESGAWALLAVARQSGGPIPLRAWHLASGRVERLGELTQVATLDISDRLALAATADQRLHWWTMSEGAGKA